MNFKILQKNIFSWLYRVSNFFGHFRVANFGANYLKTPHSDVHEDWSKYRKKPKDVYVKLCKNLPF